MRGHTNAGHRDIYVCVVPRLPPFATTPEHRHEHSNVWHTQRVSFGDSRAKYGCDVALGYLAFPEVRQQQASQNTCSTWPTFFRVFFKPRPHKTQLAARGLLQPRRLWTTLYLPPYLPTYQPTLSFCLVDHGRRTT